MLYTTTAQGCGGNPNQFYGYDLATKKVGSFNPGSGGLWPRLGPSIGKDGSVYAGSGDGDYYPEQQVYGQAIIAVKQNPTTKALELTDWYAPSNAVWLRKRDLDMNVTGPVFDYKGKEYTVQSSKECRIWLLDTSGARRRGPSHAGLPHAARLQRGSAVRRRRRLGRARDVGGTERHALGADAVLGAEAFGVQGADRARRGRARRDRRVQARREGAASVQLTPAWISRDMNQADPRSIANGVVFAYGSGEDATQATADIGLAYNTVGEPHRALDARRRSTRSTRGPARSCGRAATRSRRSITSAACRSRTAASTSARTTASCTASASSRGQAASQVSAATRR